MVADILCGLVLLLSQRRAAMVDDGLMGYLRGHLVSTPITPEHG